MNDGFLNKFFQGVAVKQLAEVDVNKLKSKQHEFNGSSSLISILDRPTEGIHYDTKYLYLSDNEEDQLEIDDYSTWYDTRRKNPERSPEYRLYFTAAVNHIVGSARAGDSLFVCLKSDETLLLIIAKQGTNIENQLYYLFGLKRQDGMIDSRLLSPDDKDDDGLGVVARMILEKIGVEYEDDDASRWSGILIDTFGDSFPSTQEFSKFARKTVTNVDPIKDPDGALVQWYDRETLFFEILERHIIETRLKQGFYDDGVVDVKGFLSFSLSVQNRRKSRAGMALENSIEAVLNYNDIMFSRGKETERKNKPDFLYPGKEEYDDPQFPDGLLTMLGAKTTSKDRWRQVLDEAKRINEKHLITLEAAISVNQTNQMQDGLLHLVVPTPIQKTYTDEQQKWLLSFGDFIKLVKSRQEKARHYSVRVDEFQENHKLAGSKWLTF